MYTKTYGKMTLAMDFARGSLASLTLGGRELVSASLPIFRAQLRAILRASAFGKTAIMLPMISTSSEIAATRKLISEEKNRLRFEEEAF